MKFSLRLNNDHPVDEYIQLAQAAEVAGFDQFWVSDDLFLRSAPVILSAVATMTETIEIGTCILNPYTIHPAEMAMMVATLDEVSNGRFNLGLSAGAGDFLNWIGLEQRKPRTAVIESLQAINALLAGERVPIDGHFLQWTDEAYLRFEPQRRVPIYLGAMSPNMLRSIGEFADGGLPLLFPPEHYANVMPYIEEGLRKSGRHRDEVDVAACIWASIDEDREAAADPLKEKIAYYGHALSPMLLEQLGLTRDDFTEIERAVQQENDIETAKALVTDDMMQIGIAGNTVDLIDRLKGLVDMGVDHISIGPPIGPDVMAAIMMIGRDVIPYFRTEQ